MFRTNGRRSIQGRIQAKRAGEQCADSELRGRGEAQHLVPADPHPFGVHESSEKKG